MHMPLIWRTQPSTNASHKLLPDADITARFCSAGEVVLYSWTEWLKEQQHLWAPNKPNKAPPQQMESDAELANALQQV